MIEGDIIPLDEIQNGFRQNISRIITLAPTI